MKKIFFITLVCVGFCVFQPAKAQYYYYNDQYYDNGLLFEIGASVGIMNCFTDIGGKKGVGKKFLKDLNLKNTKPSTSFYFMATSRNMVSVKLEATFGHVQAYDSILKPYVPNTSGRYERNLSFRSKINDFQLGVEFHPLFIADFIDKETPRFSPYVLAGIGIFSFDPQAKLEGRWYSLQPLRTEGQGSVEYRYRKPYRLTQINYPVGAGFRLEVSPQINVRLELIHRILTTDYLDDVSTTYVSADLYSTFLSPDKAALAIRLADRKAEVTPGSFAVPNEKRGDPTNKDAFFTIQLKVGMVFNRQKRNGR